MPVEKAIRHHQVRPRRPVLEVRESKVTEVQKVVPAWECPVPARRQYLLLAEPVEQDDPVPFVLPELVPERVEEPGEGVEQPALLVVT